MAHRVLIAEDRQTTALIMSGALQEAGFAVAVARDGEECLALVRSFGPELVVLDLMMPKLPGLDVLKKLKADPQTHHLGVIVCSAKDYKTEVEQASELGAFAFLAKPVAPPELVGLAQRFFSTLGPARAPAPAPAPSPGEVFTPRVQAENGVARLWGTRGSIPVSEAAFVRHGGNTSCMEIDTGTDRLIFDAGSGIRSLGLSLLAGGPRHLHLFITHTHWDHIQGFPFFAPAYIPGYHITLYAPAHTDKDLESIFRGQLDRAYFPVQMEDMRAQLEFRDLGGEALTIGGCRISWEYTVHPSPTVGYKVEIGGRRLAYVPDNEFLKGYLGSPETLSMDEERVAMHAGLIEFLTGVDVLIHEAQYPNEEYPKKIGWGHTSVANACLLVKLCAAKKWIVTHHDPAHDDTFLGHKLTLTRQFLARLGSSSLVEHAYDGLTECL
ncbi:MAG: response regulator [Candidatus Latescibacteria bacterium]|nr:response regulator [Candidatus Latescibacterota bacterium]